MKRLLGAGIVIVFIFTMLGAWWAWNYFVNQKNDGTAEEVFFEVKQGQTFTQICKELYALRLIRDPKVFSIYAKITGQAGKTKVGEYAIRGDLMPSEVLAIINSGKSIGRDFTVPEGNNIYEIAEAWEREGLGSKQKIIESARDKEFIKSLLGEDLISLEGYLYPDTYQVTKFTSERKLLAAMVRKFESEWTAYKADLEATHFTRNQLITLASIVEKETGAPEERAMISAVFYNRLKRGMMLQTDPTVLYGKMSLSNHLEGNITRSDLKAETLYNTYTMRGLPPGPISNPGKDAIVAALHPAQSEYLYFVSMNEGRHFFSKTYKEHLEAVRKFQMDPRAREGKSWRNMGH